MSRKYFMFLAAASVFAFATCAMAAGTLDLAEHVRRMMDVELPIVTDDQPQPPAKAIVLGRTKYTIPVNVQQRYTLYARAGRIRDP